MSRIAIKVTQTIPIRKLLSSYRQPSLTAGWRPGDSEAGSRSKDGQRHTGPDSANSDRELPNAEDRELWVWRVIRLSIWGKNPSHKLKIQVFYGLEVIWFSAFLLGNPSNKSLLNCLELASATPTEQRQSTGEKTRCGDAFMFGISVKLEVSIIKWAHGKQASESWRFQKW